MYYINYWNRFVPEWVRTITHPRNSVIKPVPLTPNFQEKRRWAVRRKPALGVSFDVPWFEMLTEEIAKLGQQSLIVLKVIKIFYEIHSNILKSLKIGSVIKLIIEFGTTG
jgi:hypothetical protein